MLATIADNLAPVSSPVVAATPGSTAPVVPLLPWWVTGVSIAAGLTAFLCISAIAEGVASHRRFWLALQTDHTRLTASAPARPMLQTVGGAMAVVVALLSLGALVAPVELPVGGYRLAALVQVAVAALAGAAVFAMLWTRWNRGLADAGMALVTLAVCGVATLFVPSQPRGLDDRFPLVFNALVFALAVMVWLWTWLSGVWEDQLDNGRPWTTTGRLVAPAVDFAFRIAAIALIIAFVLAAWPKLRGIAAADNTLARMGCGVAAHLVLVLAFLWCGRRTRRTRFHRAAVFGVISLLIYIGIRAL